MQAIIALVGLGVACGETDSADNHLVDTSEIPADQSYYPQRPGTTWTYLVTPLADLPSYKVVTIDAAENVGGMGASAARPAYRHTTCKKASTPENCQKPPGSDNNVDRTVGWVGTSDKIVANYREQSFKKGTTEVTAEEWWEPFRTRVDHNPAHLVAGVQWMETYKEFKKVTNGVTTSTQKSWTWQVMSTDDTVTITPPNGPAKTYMHCLKISHSNAVAVEAKTFWYARGIGKVKEVGSQTEELIDFKAPP